MYFQSDEHRYHVLAKLSLIALYILLAFDFAVMALGYFLAQSNGPDGSASSILRDIVFLVAVADLVGIFLVRKFMLARVAHLQQSDNDQNPNLIYANLLKITLIITMMCSAISTYGLILVILGEKFEILVLFVAISLLGYQFFRLRPRDFSIKGEEGEKQG